MELGRRQFFKLCTVGVATATATTLGFAPGVAQATQPRQYKLLRAKDATSPLVEFTKGEFRTVIGEVKAEIDASKVKRVIACSGKVAYDLMKARGEKKDVAIVRVEQLYPFPHKAFAAELKKYPNLAEIVWCQDEPQNQGAWFFVQHYIHENMADGQKLGYAGRPASASPAVGYAHLHQEQQKALLEQAFGKLKGFVLTK